MGKNKDKKGKNFFKQKENKIFTLCIRHQRGEQDENKAVKYK